MNKLNSRKINKTVGRQMHRRVKGNIDKLNIEFDKHFFNILNNYTVAERLFNEAGYKYYPIEGITKVIYHHEGRDKTGAFERPTDAWNNVGSVIALSSKWAFNHEKIQLRLNFKLSPSDALTYLTQGSFSWFRSGNIDKLKKWLGATSREMEENDDSYFKMVRWYISNIDSLKGAVKPRPYFKVAVLTFINSKSFLKKLFN